MYPNKKIFRCECNHEYLEITKDDDDDFVHTSFAFYTSHYTGPSISWKEKLERIWAILTGREYLYADFIFSKKTTKKIKDFLNETADK